MLIKIKVTTESKREVVGKVFNNTCNISVKEAAERGQANARIMQILRKLYPARRIRIVSGHHSPSKIISLE